MKDFIKALEILLKYNPEDVHAPFHCEHDKLYICAGIDPSDVSEKDKATLEKLGVHYDDEMFYSYRFGSC
jgi:hypothetical protein